MATKAFISYRGRDHQLADSLAQRLVDSGFASRAVLVPPNRLCEANELLLPFEYHELMEFIVDEMRGCTRFVMSEYRFCSRRSLVRRDCSAVPRSMVSSPYGPLVARCITGR